MDDEPNNLNLLSTLLTDQGYDVRQVINGQLALTIARSGDPPQLILLDIMMPEIDGYEVCKQLKADRDTDEIPVIFLSALDDPEDKVKAFEAGGADYITKPFQVREVVARIENQFSLKRLRAHIQAKNEQLQQYNQELEARVQEQTVELQQENKQLLETQKQLQAVLEQQRKTNKFKHQVITNLSPEYQILSTAIQSSTDLIERYVSNQITLEEEQLKHFARIRVGIQQLTHLINDVLVSDHLNQETLELERIPLDLVSLFSEIVEDVQLVTNCQQPIQFSYSGELPPREWHRKALRQILTHLLFSVITFSPADQPIALELVEKPQQVQFTVREYSMETPSEQQTQLFNPLNLDSNTDDLRGARLELSIAKRYVDLCQGKIEIGSKTDQGTAITVTLPILRYRS